MFALIKRFLVLVFSATTSISLSSAVLIPNKWVMHELNVNHRVDIDRLWDNLDLGSDRNELASKIRTLFESHPNDPDALDLKRDSTVIDSIAYKILERFKLDKLSCFQNLFSSAKSEQYKKTEEYIVKQCTTLKHNKVFNVECINKLTREDDEILYHCVSIKHVSLDQILQGCMLAVAYHFTTMSLLKRLAINDNTYFSPPLLVLRITVSDEDVAQIDVNDVIHSLLKQNSFVILDKIPGLKSSFVRASKTRTVLKDSLFEEYIEQTALERYLSMFIKPIIFLLLAQQIGRWLPDQVDDAPDTSPDLNSEFIKNTTELPEKVNIQQKVCFDTGAYSYTCCELMGDLSATCYGFDEYINTNIQTAPSLSFNILDNTDPLHNCCKVDKFGKLYCSQALCTSGDIEVAPCVPGGELYGVGSVQETHNQKDAELQNIVDTLYHKHTELGAENDLNGNRAFLRPKVTDTKSGIVPAPLKKLFYNIRVMEAGLMIDSCNQVSHVALLNRTNHAAVNTGYVQDCAKAHCDDSPIPIYLSNKFENDTQLDYTLGHEIAHIQQAQSLTQALVDVYEKAKIRPGFEMSADILGVLVSNYTNIAAVGVQWLTQSINADVRPCSLKPLPITRENAYKVRNLLATHIVHSPHPSDNVRGTILLKLSTMIKAAVRYFEKIRLYGPNNISNKTC